MSTSCTNLARKLAEASGLSVDVSISTLKLISEIFEISHPLSVSSGGSSLWRKYFVSISFGGRMNILDVRGPILHMIWPFSRHRKGLVSSLTNNSPQLGALRDSVLSAVTASIPLYGL